LKAGRGRKGTPDRKSKETWGDGPQMKGVLIQKEKKLKAQKARGRKRVTAPCKEEKKKGGEGECAEIGLNSHGGTFANAHV